jgi:DNA-binding NarL/FixJ family response regulator
VEESACSKSQPLAYGKLLPLPQLVSENMTPVRILLVDDSPQFLICISRFLASRAAYEVVGQALSGDEALQQAALLHPDLVLMDISMPGLNGLEATARLKRQPDPPRVVIMTLLDTAEYRAAARSAKADDFVAKDCVAEQLLPAIAGLFPG